MLTITYRDADVQGVNEETLTLLYFNPETGDWSSDGITVLARRPDINQLDVSIAHLTTFALGVETPHIYLPAILSAR